MGRALSQLGTDRTEADYDETTITNEEANDAIAKSQHIVDVIQEITGPNPVGVFIQLWRLGVVYGRRGPATKRAG